MMTDTMREHRTETDEKANNSSSAPVRELSVWLSKAARVVRAAIKWLGAFLWEKLELMGALAWSFISNLPRRLRRIVVHFRHLITGTLSWLRRGLWAWRGIKGLGVWLWEGLSGGLTWGATLLLYLLELLGVGESIQLLWGLIFRLRKLTSAEISASQDFHAPGQIPYWQIRVDDNSLPVKIATFFARLSDPQAGARPFATMHILHFPAGGASLDVVVHELTHVAQYERVGAIYMPQALHAQATLGKRGAYKYGDLEAALAQGKHFSDFNREQQAQICQDYYCAGCPKGTAFEPFIKEMQAGQF